MKRLLPVLFVTVTISLMCISNVKAATLEVCPNGGGCTYEYTGGGAVNAIQTAIDAAGDGDTVYIYNGTYASPEVDLTSSHTGITIEGESLAGVILTESYFRIGSAANGAATNITVKNLTIQDSYDVNNGIEIVNSTGVVLRNLSITGSGGEGVKITGSATVDIYNCKMSTGSSAGLRINGSGVEVDGYNLNIVSNTFQGVLVEDVSVFNIVNSRVASNGSVGIQVNQGSTVDIRNTNVYSNTTYGMNVSSVTSLTNDYNNVYGNTSGAYTGDISAGVHSLSVDPDLALTGVLNCTSGLINTGDPSITDVDESVSDIGMYGGPNSGFDGINFVCSGDLFCHITEESHTCIECLLDSDCTGEETCNTDTNACEVLGAEDGPDDPGDVDPDPEETDDGDLPATIVFKEDPVFYSILSVFLITIGYILYAQKKYGRRKVGN
jgi:hypothetical protein